MQNTAAYLLCRRRRKDCAGYGAGEKAGTDKGGEGRLVAGAAAADEGDLWGGGEVVGDFVGEIDLDAGVCVGEGEEGGVDEVRGVVDEVFGWGLGVRWCSFPTEVG